MKRRLIQMGIGAVAGVVAGKLLSSHTVKQACVNTVAEGLKIKESLDKTIENVRANTNDIVAEAKVKKAQDEANKKAYEEKMDIERVAQEAKDDIDEAVEKAKEQVEEE